MIRFDGQGGMASKGGNHRWPPAAGGVCEGAATKRIFSCGKDFGRPVSCYEKAIENDSKMKKCAFHIRYSIVLDFCEEIWVGQRWGRNSSPF